MRIRYLIWIWCFGLICAQASEKTKLYCMYTPNFEILFAEYFLPSIQDDFEVKACKIPSDCPSGIFRSEGWNLAMLRKLELLKKAIQENQNNQIFIYSDIDVIFFKPVLKRCLELLGGLDFLVQRGWPRSSLCAGFFVMRGNEKTFRLICKAESLLREELVIDDQLAIQEALKLMKGEIDWGFLPPEEFTNGRRVLRQLEGYYSRDSEIILPSSIILFHATSCIGLESKIDFLKRVQFEYLSREK